MAGSTILAKMAVLISANSAEFNRALSDTSSRLASFESTFKRLGNQIAAGLGFYGISQLVTSTIQSLAQFQQSMSEVKAITGATGADFQALRDNALNLAGAFKAIDISKLETEFGRLGFSTKEIIASTEATINLASATGSDLASSAQIAGSTLRAFNLDASNMGRVSDVMAGALNRTALDMTNFSEAIKYVAPNAHAANISLEETSALLGILADNGIRGSMAGTTLRRIIQDLSKDSRPLIDRLQELSAKGLTLSGAMDEVGRIGSTGLLVLAGNTGKLESLSAALHHVTGESKEMARVMNDNLIGDWKKLAAEWDKIAQSQGGGVSGFLRELLQNLKDQTVVLESNRSLWEKVFGSRSDYKAWAESIAHPGAFLNAGKDTSGGGGAPGWVKDYLAKTTDFTTPPIPKQKMTGAMPGIGDDIFQGQLERASVGAKDLLDSLQAMREATAQNVEEFGQLDTQWGDEADNLLPSVMAGYDALVAKGAILRTKTADLGLSTKQMARMMRTELVNIGVAFGQLIGNLASVGGDDIGKVLLGQLGRVAVQLGEMLIAVGIGVEAFKESLSSLNGPVAIAAGIALVAVGTAFSNFASSAGSGGSSVSGGVARAADSYNSGAHDIHVTFSPLTLDRQGFSAGVKSINYRNSQTG